MKSEAKFKATVVRRLRELGCMVIISEVLNCPGFPDVMVIYNGMILFVEFKATEKKSDNGYQKLLRSEQKIFFRKLALQGFIVLVCAKFSDWAALGSYCNNSNKNLFKKKTASGIADSIYSLYCI